MVRIGEYICSSSSGVMIRGQFHKLNRIIVLDEKDVKDKEILSLIKEGYLKYSGPKDTKKQVETVSSSPVKVVQPETQKTTQDKSEKEQEHVKKN